MSTIVTRSGKGAALTHIEVDANFTNLNTDKAEASAVILATEKGAVSGVCPLDATSKVSSTYLPSYVDDVLEYANYAALPATGETGKIYVTLDTNKTYRWSGSAYIYITSGAVDSVAGKTGVVTLTAADVGLGNVTNNAAVANLSGTNTGDQTLPTTLPASDVYTWAKAATKPTYTATEVGLGSVNNTTDVGKPVSTATQTALDLKAPLASPTLSNPTYTGTLTGGTGVVAIGTNQIYKDASGNVGIGTSVPATSLTVQAGLGTGIKVYDATSNLAGTSPCVESIGSRGDANNTFGGRFGAGSRRNDGTVIPTGWWLGQYAFGGQWGTGTTYNQTNFLYSASIAGVSDGSFTSATAMPTALVFNTGSAGTSLQSTNTAYGTERMRIDSAGNITLQKNISVGGAAPTTSGSGITFPAADSASSNANTLDDYEEGTWTPTYVNFTITSGTSEAKYTKVGRVITANIWINATSLSCLANATFTLPIASVSYSAGSAVSSNVVGGIQITASTTGTVRTAITTTGNLALTVTYQLA